MILCASIVSHKSLMEEATKCLFRTSLRSTHIQFILISATNWRHTNTSYMVSAYYCLLLLVTNVAFSISVIVTARDLRHEPAGTGPSLQLPSGIQDLPRAAV